MDGTMKMLMSFLTLSLAMRNVTSWVPLGFVYPNRLGFRPFSFPQTPDSNWMLHFSLWLECLPT